MVWRFRRQSGDQPFEAAFFCRPHGSCERLKMGFGEGTKDRIAQCRVGIPWVLLCIALCSAEQIADV